MAIWTVHAPPDGDSRLDDAERAVFIRERISWMALLFGPLWILRHRLWRVLVGWALAVAAIVTLGVQVNAIAGTVLFWLFWLWFAIVANDARRRTLERRGWELVGLIHAGGHDEAERLYFNKVHEKAAPAWARVPEARAAGNAPSGPAAAGTPDPAATRPVVPGGGALPPIVGFTETRP